MLGAAPPPPPSPLFSLFLHQRKAFLLEISPRYATPAGNADLHVMLSASAHPNKRATRVATADARERLLDSCR